MQTATNWLEQRIKDMIEHGADLGEDLPALLVHIKQAKQLEKQQIIDAFDEGQEYEYQYQINDAPKFDSQTYFIETYGSKGSDEHIVDTNKMIYPKTAFEILQPKLTIADTFEFREKHLPEILDAMEEYATSSQTEISKTTTTDTIDGIIFELPFDDKIKLWEIIDKLVEENRTKRMYSEEDLREALFYALNIDRINCCTTRTTDSIVRESIQSLKTYGK